MTDDKRFRFPPITVSEELYELVRYYAYIKRRSISDSVRILLSSSRELEEFSKANLVDLTSVGQWGGSRKPKRKKLEKPEPKKDNGYV